MQKVFLERAHEASMEREIDGVLSWDKSMATQHTTSTYNGAMTSFQ